MTHMPKDPEHLLPNVLSFATHTPEPTGKIVYPPGVYKIVKPEELIKFPDWKLVTLISRSAPVLLEHKKRPPEAERRARGCYDTSPNCGCYTCTTAVVYETTAALGTEVLCLIVEPADTAIERLQAALEVQKLAHAELHAAKTAADRKEAEMQARACAFEKTASAERAAHTNTRDRLNKLETELGTIRKAQAILVNYIGTKKADELLGSEGAKS